MNNKRLFLDMDGTIARFHDNILDSEGHVQIELMYENEFFRTLEPFQNMIDGMKLFISCHPEVEVFSLSAAQLGDPPGFVRQKDAWLDEFLPEIDKSHRIFTECGVPKSGYIPGGVSVVDYLLDDFNKNLNEWIRDGGKSIKCKNNINHKGTGKFGGDVGNLWTGDMVSNLDAPKDILYKLENFMGLEHEMEKEFMNDEKCFGPEPDMLVIFATPLKENYPAVEIDISKRDLERALKEVYIGKDIWNLEEFLNEYTWDNGDQIKDFLERHQSFCKDNYKVNGFADSKYAVTITDWGERRDNNISKHTVASFYPAKIDEAFVEMLHQKGYEGFHILVSRINEMKPGTLLDGIVDTFVVSDLQNIEDSLSQKSSLDEKIFKASKESNTDSKNSEPELEM